MDSNTVDIPQELEQKGCFIMFNFNELNMDKLYAETKRDRRLYLDRSNSQEEEEKESDKMQIDSSSSLARKNQ